MSANRMKSGLLAVAVVPLLVASATVAATASSASAEPSGTTACSHPTWENKSPGKGTPKGDSAKIRSGPSEDCSVTKEVSGSTVLQYHCWVENEHGHKWTHVRIDGKDTMGWVYNDRLDDGGSKHPANKC
ncbi:SH3 domain-containing protein [Streptomyces sp. SCA3-4]|uniref:SH3 domain-containing protein n=1 Tax=Streptomyces sichuanensis TaxID=2871810 RepID=UPI001CE2DDEF|nr:SH3 domain-containing protein [Streptomyces sichuanensis]MCA6091336.1 SH3 domain-containing protein [Streptomyces sichuanensis]